MPLATLKLKMIGESLVPLDEKIWQAWLEKNRRREEFYFARRLKIAMFLSPVLLATLLFWLFGR